MTSRTMVADEYDFIQARIRDLKREKDASLCLAERLADIMCFYDSSRPCWWHLGLTERGRLALPVRWPAIAPVSGWFRASVRYDEVGRNDPDIIIVVLPNRIVKTSLDLPTTEDARNGLIP